MVSDRHLPKASSCGAVTGVSFMLIVAILCLQSQFEDYTFCIAEDSKILLLLWHVDRGEISQREMQGRKQFL